MESTEKVLKPVGIIVNDKQKEIMARLVQLSTGGLPESHTDNGKKLWKAFDLGRQFEKEKGR